MPRTVRTKVYQFSELSEQGKENAIDWYRNNVETFFETDDAQKSLEKFSDIFDIRILDIDFLETGRNRYIFRPDENIASLTGERLAKYIYNNYKEYIFKGKYYGKLVNTFKDGSPIHISNKYPNGQRHVKRYSKCTLTNDCVLTGTCYDHSVLTPIYDFINRPGNQSFEELIEECINRLCEDVEKELFYRLSDESIIENIEATEYEFTKDGKVF